VHASITRAAERSFGSLFAIPGDRTIILAQAPQLTASILFDRSIKRGIAFVFLSYDQIRYLLDPNRRARYLTSLQKTNSIVNTDDRPFAVYALLESWNKQFSVSGGSVFAWFKRLTLLHCLVFLLLAAVIAWWLRKRWRGLNSCLCLIMCTTGFWGMLMTLILLFAYQAAYGSAYYAIGLLTGVFMAGNALGAYLCSRLGKGGQHSLYWLLRIEIMLGAGTFLLALYARGFMQTGWPSQVVFALFFLIAGGCVGAEFALANNTLHSNRSAQEIAGRLYACDLIGAWGAGMVGGAILLPIIGITQTLFFLAALKAATAILLRVRLS
jgi:spermidine synthase